MSSKRWHQWQLPREVVAEWDPPFEVLITHSARDHWRRSPGTALVHCWHRLVEYLGGAGHAVMYCPHFDREETEYLSVADCEALARRIELPRFRPPRPRQLSFEFANPQERRVV